MKRVLRYSVRTLAGLLLVLGVVLGVLLGMTRTQWGEERIRLFLEREIQERVNGQVRLGRVSAPRITSSLTLHDFSIVDIGGRQFLHVDSLRLGYGLRPLLAGEIVFRRAEAYGPSVVFERLSAGARWNIQQLFPTPEAPGQRRLIRLEDVQVTGGDVVIRMPWEPDPPVDPEDAPRLLLEPVPEGLARDFRFAGINAQLPVVVWESPTEPEQVFQIASLATSGYIWKEPFQMGDLQAVVTRRDSILSFDAERLELPASILAAEGQVVFGGERVRLDVLFQGDDVAYADLQWLYPPLPDTGGGSLDFRIETQEPIGTLWLAEDAHLVAPGTELKGSFGIVTGDTLFFTRVDLAASPLDVDLLESVLPVELPVDGLLAGTVVMEGPLSALSVSGDLQLASALTTPAPALSWDGTLDLRRPFGARGLKARLSHLDLSLLAALHPSLDGAGTVSGRIDADGRMDGPISFATTLQHQLADSDVSGISGTGIIQVGPPERQWRPWQAEADLDIDSLSLAVASAIFPALPQLDGQLSGPLRLDGSATEMDVEADLVTPIGRLALDGHFHMDDGLPAYRAGGRLSGFELHRVITGAPEGELSADFRLDGSGATQDDLRGRLDVDVDSVTLAGLHFSGADLRLAVHEGIADLDRLRVRSPAAELNVTGSFGLTPEREGSLQVGLTGRSLAAFRSLVFGDVAPDQDTVPQPPELGGSLELDATLEGSLTDFHVQGSASFRDLLVGPLVAGHGTVSFGASGTGLDLSGYELSLEAEDVDLFRRSFDRGTLQLVHGATGGELALATSGPSERYRVVAGFGREDDATRLDLRELTLEPGASRWSLVSPGTIRFDDQGLTTDRLELVRDAEKGRLSFAGRLPWVRTPGETWTESRMQADLQIGFQDLDLRDFSRIVAPEQVVGGVLDGSVLIQGRARAPTMEVDLAVDRPRYQDLELDRIIGRVAYSDRGMIIGVDGWHQERSVIGVTGNLPLDLTLGTVSEDRWRSLPADVSIHLDSLPAKLPAALSDAFYGVEGSLHGTLVASGTGRDMRLGGILLLQDGIAGVQATRVSYRDLQGTFRFLGDRRVEVAAGGRGGAGRAQVGGSIDFQQLSDPEFDLVLQASEFEAARRRDVEMVASGELHLKGRYSRPLVNVGLRIDRGTLFLDELTGARDAIQLESRFLLDLIDQEFLPERQVPEENPFLQGLRLEGTLRAERDLWLRSREINVELAGALEVDYDRQRDEPRLLGTLNVIRGNYRLRGRRFDVREGEVEFVGTPGMDPNLSITAVYPVRTIEGTPLEIRAVLTGTLEDPRVSLESDAEPPLSESDLFSYLLFGRPTYALAPSETHALGLATAGLGLGMRVVGPHVLGYAAAGLETVAHGMGLDYVAITAADAAFDDAFGGLVAGDMLAANLLAGTQVELGRYIADNLFLAYSQRLAGASPRYAGARVEWRFRPTWFMEFFAEDRFARTPGFGLEQVVEPRKVFGLSLFRDWRY